MRISDWSSDVCSSDLFDHHERWANVPSHRALAMLRGRNEEILMLEIEVDADDVSTLKPAEKMIADAFAIPVSGTAADAWLLEVAQCTWRVKLSFSLDRKSTRLNSSHQCATRMPSSACNNINKTFSY